MATPPWLKNMSLYIEKPPFSSILFKKTRLHIHVSIENQHQKSFRNTSHQSAVQVAEGGL